MIDPTTRLVTSNVFSLADAPVRRHRAAITPGLNTELWDPGPGKPRVGAKQQPAVDDCPTATVRRLCAAQWRGRSSPCTSRRGIAEIDFRTGSAGWLSRKILNEPSI